MQNILVSGFENEPNTTSTVEHNNITAKLGDLGIVMEPAKGLVQPIVYRAPEVYFRNEISPAADIWSWGLIYCQLLEAQAAFNKYGIYDELLLQTSQVQKERSVERAIAHDFGLGGLNYYRDAPLPYHDRSHPEGKQWDYLRSKGIAEKEIEFLQWVLDPVPTDRPTAQDILDAGWLTSASSESTGVDKRLTADLKARNRNVHRKRSDPGLSKMLGGQPPPPQGLSASSMFTGQQQPVQVQQRSVPPQPQQPAQYQQYQYPQQSRMSVNDSVLQSRPRPKDNRSAPVLQRGDVPPSDGTRPLTPRSNTERPTGGTFINYGAVMR
jgi:serine/threonine protein kinase